MTHFYSSEVQTSNRQKKKKQNISDGLAVVGLHQTKDFSYPAITFIASDMKNKIEKLKNSGLENFSEIGESNIVLTTPEQQKINLFKLGM
ncbi:MAG TPA: hypothetical protein VN958_02645 [Chitinophagaceae bacterium]|nr:hypothetical protein [Chitinophagaceae bacterium]